MPGSASPASAPTARVIDVVELLARPGSPALRFTDVVSELGLTQATAHAILMTLCDRGWASRNPADKTFSLGPQLSVIAAHTDLARPLGHAARTAARQLHAELGYDASVVERVGDVLVITAYEAGDRKLGVGIPVDRIPYSPPFGVAFAAWDTDGGQRAWIERATTNNPELAHRLKRVLDQTRDRGFDIDWTTPALAQTVQAVGTLDSDALPPHVRGILDQLLVEFTAIGLVTEDDARGAQPVATIAAPVFDHRGSVALIIGVHPMHGLSSAETARIGRHLTRATTAISTIA